MPDQLVEFLRSKKKDQTADSAIDWQAKKDAWIESVNKLYTQVQVMLRDSIVSGDVTVNLVEMQITEQFVGTYSIPRLELSVGGERVEFRPMGLTIIGAAGRVDIRGERDVVTLIKNDTGTESEWSIVLQRVPFLKLAEFDPDTLKYALERVMLPLS
jgi:hypothetical protein